MRGVVLDSLEHAFCRLSYVDKFDNIFDFLPFPIYMVIEPLSVMKRYIDCILGVKHEDCCGRCDTRDFLGI